MTSDTVAKERSPLRQICLFPRQGNLWWGRIGLTLTAALGHLLGGYVPAGVWAALATTNGGAVATTLPDS